MDQTQKATSLDEPRLFEETGVEARIVALVEPVLRQMAFRIVRVRLSGLNGSTLQIMAERDDGSMSIDDCEQLSRAVSSLLDVEDLISHEYHLEISSPGIDRPLVRKSDFKNWQNHLGKFETTTIINGRKKFRGFIKDVNEEGFIIEAEDKENGDVRVRYDDIAGAHLVLTDELIKDALAKDKALRQHLKSDEALAD